MGRPRGKALALSDVLAAGIQVVERAGMGALTLANVARELGIKPPSVCHHVPTNEELRFLLAEHGWSELAAQLALLSGVAEPRQRLIAYARSTRSFALARPRCFELMLQTRLPHARVARSPLWQQLLLPLFVSFRELGLAEAQLVHATRALRSALSGFLLLEIAGQFQMAARAQEGAREGVDQSFECLVGALLDGLCPGTRRPDPRPG